MQKPINPLPSAAAAAAAADLVCSPPDPLALLRCRDHTTPQGRRHESRLINIDNTRAHVMSEHSTTTTVIKKRHEMSALIEFSKERGVARFKEDADAGVSADE